MVSYLHMVSNIKRFKALFIAKPVFYFIRSRCNTEHGTELVKFHSYSISWKGICHGMVYILVYIV